MSMCSERWIRLHRPERLADVVKGVKFVNGIEENGSPPNSSYTTLDNISNYYHFPSLGSMSDVEFSVHIEEEEEDNGRITINSSRKRIGSPSCTLRFGRCQVAEEDLQYSEDLPYCNQLQRYCNLKSMLQET